MEATAMMFEKYEILRAPFPADLIGRNQDGMDFVGHAAVTDRINTVDPAWNWEPFACNENGTPLITYRPMGERTNKKGDTYTWSVASLWINITICGVTRPAVGNADCYPWSDSVEKQLISDAIKNGAMRFGVAIDLWSKEDLLAEPRATQQEIDAISAVLAAITDQAARNTAVAAWKAKFGEPSSLAADRAGEAMAFAEDLAAGAAE